ncbi:MAG: hypothetical protein GX558_11345 [Clostridiales bacterium]|nr:hypothetical protein [Clostridiales bacterium]
MRDAWRLARVQWMGMLGLNRALHGPKRAAAVAKWVLLAAVIGLSVPVSLGSYYYLMAGGLAALGQLRLFPSVALAVCALLALITSAPRAGDALLAFKDYDRVLSLPVSLRAVAASRVMLVMSMEMLYALVAMAPAGAVYAYLARPPLIFYPIYIAAMLAAPAIPTVVGSAVGALLSRLVAGRRGGKTLHLIVLLAVTLGFMSLSMTSAAPERMAARLTDLGGLLGGAINRLYPLAPLFTAAVADLNLGAAALFVALSMGALWGATELLALSMRGAHEKLAAVPAAGRRGGGRVSSSPPLGALYAKEMRRYFASVIYVFNTGFGSILMVMGAVALRVMGLGKVLAMLEIAVPGGLPTGALLAAALSAMVTTVNTTGTTISLEGKHVWILKSLPLPAACLLLAKALVCLTMSLPFVALSVAIVAGALPLTAADIALMLLLPSLYAVFSALIGLWFNLRWHRFDWSNETAVVKQSMGALVPMLLSFALLAGPVMLYIRFPAARVEWLTAALVAAIDGLLALHLLRRGDALVRAL